MSLLVSGCTLLSLTTAPKPTDTGWAVSIEAKIGAEAEVGPQGCTITYPLDSHTRFIDGGGKVRPPNERKYKLYPWRFHESIPDVSGGRVLTIPLPELGPGDKVDLELDVQVDGLAPLRWQPGLTHTAFAELKLASPPGDLSGINNDGKWLWVEAPASDATALLAHPAEPGAAERVTETAQVECAALRPPKSRSNLALSVPGKDPQRALWPGAGSSVTETRTLRFPDGPACSWVIPMNLPNPDLGGPPVEVQVTGATLTRVHGGVVISVPAGSAEVVVTWTEPDAPVFGESPVDESGRPTTTVVASDGEIGWEPLGDSNAAWRLISWLNKPIIAERDQLLAGIQYRFATQSFPEPGAPMKLRGHSGGWELAALLRDALLSRASIANIPVEPLWPRHLVTARRERVLSPVEAALILAMYLNQNKFSAQWVLVRPGNAGPGAAVSPAGYTDALVRVTWADEVRWMDPGCPMCGPFELRSELTGASAMGWDADRTPEEADGLERITDEGQLRTVELRGPPALRVRQALAELPAAAQRQALVDQFAPTGTLGSVVGLSELGAAVRVEFTLPTLEITTEAQLEEAPAPAEQEFYAPEKSFP